MPPKALLLLLLLTVGPLMARAGCIEDNDVENEEDNENDEYVSQPRFDLYVRESFNDSSFRGPCPFCQRAAMAMLHKVPKEEINFIPINLRDKPQDFLDLYPGKAYSTLSDT